jgi:hypothetical protein
MDRRERGEFPQIGRNRTGKHTFGGPLRYRTRFGSALLANFTEILGRRSPQVVVLKEVENGQYRTRTCDLLRVEQAWVRCINPLGIKSCSNNILVLGFQEFSRFPGFSRVYDGFSVRSELYKLMGRRRVQYSSVLNECSREVVHASCCELREANDVMNWRVSDDEG